MNSSPPASATYKKALSFTFRPFTFEYEIEYTAVDDGQYTMSGASVCFAEATNGSPPQDSPTYSFSDNQVSFEFTTADEGEAHGSMQIMPLQHDGENDAAIWCDFYYGPNDKHHFEGVSVLFNTTVTVTSPPADG